MYYKPASFLCLGIPMDQKTLKTGQFSETNQDFKKLTFEKYMIFSENAQDWEYWRDEDGRFRYVSPACARITGYIPEEFTKDPELYLNITHPEDRARVKNHRCPYEEGEYGVVDPLEFRIVRKDGQLRWISHLCNEIYDDRGRLLGRRGTNRDITSSKVAERQRESPPTQRAQNYLLERLVNQGSVAIAVVKGPDLEFTSVNLLYQQIVGPETKIIGRTYTEIFPQAADLGIDRRMRDVMLTGKPWRLRDFETSMHEWDRTAWWDADFLPLPDENGQMDSLLILAWDNTDRREVQEMLRRKEERLRKFIQVDTIGILFFDQTGRIVDANDTILRLSGYSRADLESGILSWQKLTPPEWVDKVRAEMKKLDVTGNFGPCEKEYVRKDGSRWMGFFVGARLHDGTTVVYAIDITRDKEAERHLAEIRDESERMKRLNEAIMSSTPDLVYVFDLNHRFIYANEALLKMWGLTWEAAAGKTLLEIGYEKWHAAMHDREIDQVIATKQPVRGEVPFTGTQGRRMYDYIFVPVYGADGEVEAIGGTTRDITERKRAEEALRKSEENFREAFEHAPVGIAITELEGRFIHVNDAYCDMLGYSREELLCHEMSFQKLTHPEDIGENLEAFNRLLSSEIPAFFLEKRYIRKDGRIIWVRASVTLRRDVTGNPVQAVAIIEDITVRKETEEQLRQSQKMEAIGRLAGGVAHEFNNMLNVILGYSEMLGSQLTEESPLHKYAREIGKAARRSAEITGKLLAYSRKQAIQPKVIDLNENIWNQKIMLTRLIGEAIQIDFQPGADLWPVRIDPSQVDQIMTNLAVNSRDAIPGTGTVTINTRNIHLDQPDTPPDLPPGDYVKLTFRDNGIGMDKAVQEKIFEPYFTTKDVGKGTGLGLSTVYGIVKQNSGAIEVLSKPGEGTTFAVYFPRIRAEAEGAATEKEYPLSRGFETVLIVEDEKQVLQLAEMILKEAGYNVMPASTPREAIDIALRNKGKIDLLISDMIMPEMDGQALISKLSSISPIFRTIFMSGYTDEVLAGIDLSKGDVNFIKKPFTVQSLTQKVREVLDSEKSEVKTAL